MSMDALNRVVFVDAVASAEVDEWFSGFDPPPCFSCGSTTQGVAQKTINIRQNAERGTYAFLNVICRVCNDQAMAHLSAQRAASGSPVDSFNRAMGITPEAPDPEKMS